MQRAQQQQGMADFKGVSERFNLQMLSEDGYDSDRVVVVIGLEGLLIKTADGSRTLRKYPLTHISRWALKGSSLVRGAGACCRCCTQSCLQTWRSEPSPCRPAREPFVQCWTP